MGVAVVTEDIGVARSAMRIPAQTPLRNLLRALEILAWAAFFAFAALFLALRYWLLPNVEQYRADLVAAMDSQKVDASEVDVEGYARFHFLAVDPQKC